MSNESILFSIDKARQFLYMADIFYYTPDDLLEIDNNTTMSVEDKEDYKQDHEFRYP